MVTSPRIPSHMERMHQGCELAEAQVFSARTSGQSSNDRTSDEPRRRHGTFIPRRKHRFPSAQRSQTPMGPISTEFGDALGTQGDVLLCLFEGPVRLEKFVDQPPPPPYVASIQGTPRKHHTQLSVECPSTLYPLPHTQPPHTTGGCLQFFPL